ncbi:MAG: HAMP domain-containing sensor histidine kinase, partial [Bacillota bacterium]
MKLSVRLRLFAMISGLIVFFILLSWLFNARFMGKYYFHNKKNSLIKTYHQINAIYRSNISQIALQLEKIENDQGVLITIISNDYTMIYDSWFKDKEPRPKPPPGAKRKPPHSNPRSPEVFLKSNANQLRHDQIVIKVFKDSRINADLVFLAAVLQNGNYLLLRTPMAAIKESVTIANRFLMITGLFAILVGSLLVFILTGRFTRPILDLKEIAHKMARLDFTQKYTGNCQDEIGELGQSINSLSQQLEISITALTKANRKLQADIMRERQIDEMRKNFISNVSHELKTPIALIQGYAEGLKMNVIDDAESKDFYCEVIMDEATKMNRLVKQLLELAKLESGSLPLEPESFNLGKLLEHALKRNRLLFEEKAVRVESALGPDLWVKGDIDLIEQVINNYLSNALNHVAGAGLIRVGGEVNGSKLRIKVFNSGLPIPEESREKIWGSFYKVDKARTREYGGSGLGLSIVRAIQEAHGN